MRQEESMTSTGWMVLWWLFGFFAIPITMPWLLYRIFHQKSALKKMHGKVVLITGASSGLGEALAHVFYRAGCRVVLAARREDQLQRVRADLLSTHLVSLVQTVPMYPPVVLPLDLTDLQSLPEVATRVLAIFKHVDILVNNGGVSFRGDVITTSIAVDLKVMLVNYFGQVALTKALLPSMIARRSGHIVAVSSVQGRIAIPHRSAYAASKHALQAFCDTVRAEVAQHNINVTVVSPGYIKTSLSLNALTGSGDRYGVNDETTSKGYSPHFVADEILTAVLKEQCELIISPALPRLAILLRTVAPFLYFYIMQWRAQ